jgi:hypothetical protein
MPMRKKYLNKKWQRNSNGKETRKKALPDRTNMKQKFAYPELFILTKLNKNKSFRRSYVDTVLTTRGALRFTATF